MAVKPAEQADTTEDPAFSQSRYLLAPRRMARDARYVVSAGDGEPLIFVKRTAAGSSGFVAGGAGIVAGLIIFLFLNSVGDSSDALVFHVVLAGVGLGLGIVAATLIHAHLGDRTQFVLLRKDQFGEKLGQIQRIEKMAIPYLRWTITNSKGRLLATVRINVFSRLLRSTWHVFAADGKVLAVMSEEKLWRALARRLLALLPVQLPSDHVVKDPMGLVGHLNRTATLQGRHVLDLTPDVGRRLDRQVAVSVGALVDILEQ